MRTRLIIVRHAEAEGNSKRHFQGWTDGRLTEKGHMQAKRVAERLRATDIDVLYSSSLTRALQTASYISGLKKLPIIRTDGLKEINGGDWEDVQWDKLPQRWPEEYDTWENRPHLLAMPNGETMEQFQQRLIEEIKLIIDGNPGKNICIVTHGTAIKALMCHFRTCSLEEMYNINWCDNTAVTVIDYENESFNVVLEGDSSHLDRKLSTVWNQEWWEETRKNIIDRRKSAMSANKLINWLFETKAMRVCPEDKPFWYTSGTIGPYYINTHFLYGSEAKANDLLSVIDSAREDKLACPSRLLERIEENYRTDDIFSGLIDEMTDFLKSTVDLDGIDYISGGERRDWFFSLIIAKLLKKPHIAIYKDLTAVLTENGGTAPADDLKGGRVLHIADLITEASSYERAWIPAVRNISGEMKWSLAVVDRKQGGGELLQELGVRSLSMVAIDDAFFTKALELGLINRGQYEMLLEYAKNPREAMKSFLEKHPEFIENSLASDEKTRERAKLCLEKGIYL
jgi:broad specificity phosphatase PhoE/orotate phosphoribosyltransferase